MEGLNSVIRKMLRLNLPDMEGPNLLGYELYNVDLVKNALSSKETDIEIESSEVTEILPRCGDQDESQIGFLDEVYKGSSMSSLYSSPLDIEMSPLHITEIKTPMKNTVLHIAASHGNDENVSNVINLAPKLLFLFNENNDSVLHVAARAGHISIVKMLLAAYANYEDHVIAKAWLEYNNNHIHGGEKYNSMSNMKDLLEFVKRKNAQGNTILHEAMLCRDKSIGVDEIFKAFEPYTNEDMDGKSLSKCFYEYALDIANNAKQSVLYLAVENGDKNGVGQILDRGPNTNAKPEGLSPVVAAIMKRNHEMLKIILVKKPSWIHLTDKSERFPLHYAASIGYLKGVVHLLGICKCCTNQMDKNGYFPIHLASNEGHVEVVKKLLEYCRDPTEMLDKNHKRNILHIAAKNGKHEVVQSILKSQIREHQKMINQKDNIGDTPLHLAAKSCHPKTVFNLTWDERVDLGIVNQNNETALDVVNSISQLTSSSARKQLTCTALDSAGAKPNFGRPVPDKSRQSDSKLTQKSNDNDKVSNAPQYFFLTGSNTQYKDRVETITLVSTLIITASVAAYFAIPGKAQGKAYNLYHAMFQFFIVFITMSLFSSISATILLFWAKLGLNEFVGFSLKLVMPLLGIALISLSLACVAGLYTVISELCWLANLFLVISVIFVVVVFLLYIILFLPSSSTRKPLRLISYYPFLFLASLAE